MITIILISAYIRQPTAPTEEQLSKRFSEFKIQYDEKKAEGYDVTEAEEFARKAKRAFDRKDYRTANKLLESAFEALEKATISVAPVKPIKVETNCIDGIDNDGDGLIDNEDGDCWIREGPIYETHPYYYDGTFKGLIKKIPEIADLGVKTIYIMPIWEHDRGPSLIYRVLDYHKIDPKYGTEEELKELVNTVHRYDMKIIFDLTTSIGVKKSVIWSNGWNIRISLSELQEKAKHLGWDLEYKATPEGKFVYYHCQQKNSAMWCEVCGEIIDDDVVLYRYPRASRGPAIDRTNPEVIKYFTKIAKFYVENYNIDGWRIDNPRDNWNPKVVSGDHSIVKLLRSIKKSITEVNPNSILYAENSQISTSKEPVLDEMCEASYSYPFQNYVAKINWRTSTSKDLLTFLENEKVWYNRTKIRFLETHDTKRIKEIYPQLSKPLLVLILTIPGIPMIQAGQEIGATNQFFSDSPQVDWANGDYELREFYKKVFEIRNNNNALKYGSISNVWKSGDNTYAYLRNYEDERVIVVINFLDKKATSTLDLSFLDKGTVLHDELNNENFVVDDPNKFEISVRAYGSRILVLEDRK